MYYFYSLPQEDSDYERDHDHAPPTPPPRKLSRRGASLRLACIGKQQSDENPLMKKIAEPLKLAQTQVPGYIGYISLFFPIFPFYDLTKKKPLFIPLNE